MSITIQGACTRRRHSAATALVFARVILLGYDLHGDHFFGSHPDKTLPPFLACLKAFERLVAPAKAAGLEIVNCTPGSALKAFPMASLASVLERAA